MTTKIYQQIRFLVFIYLYTFLSTSIWAQADTNQDLPVALCIERISVDVSQPVLNARDIDEGSYDNQTAAESLEFSIARTGEDIYGPDSDLYGTQTEIIFTAEDVCNRVLVTLAIFDQDGNSNICLSEVSVTSPLSFCAFDSDPICINQSFFVSPGDDILVSAQDLNFDKDAEYLLDIEGLDNSQSGIDFAFFSSDDIGTYTYTLTTIGSSTKCTGTIEIKEGCAGDNCPNSIVIEDKTVQSGEDFCLSVTAEIKDGLGALQTGIKWNPAHLTFIRLDDVNVPGIKIGNPDQQAGHVPFTYLDNNPVLKVTDISFNLCFSARDVDNVRTEVKLASIPGLPFEATSTQAELINISIDQGVVIIGDPALTEPLCNISILCTDAMINCSDMTQEFPLPQITFQDNCTSDSAIVEELRRTGKVNDCNAGELFIEYFVDLDSSNSLSSDEPFCKSTITVNQDEVFDPTKIKWPASLTGETVTGQRINADGSIDDNVEIELPSSLSCLDTDEAVAPVWCQQECGLVAYTYEDEIFMAEAGGIPSIIRTHTLISWCEYDTLVDMIEASEEVSYVQDLNATGDESCNISEESKPEIYATYINNDVKGIYSHVQTIQIKDTRAPTIIEETGIIPEVSVFDIPERTVLSLRANDSCLNSTPLIEKLIWNVDIVRLLSTEEEVSDINPITKKGPSITLSKKDFPFTNTTEAYKVIVAVTDVFGNISQVNFLVIVISNTVCWSYDQRQCNADDFAGSIDATASAKDMAEAMKTYLESISIPTVSVTVEKDFNQNVCEACTTCPMSHRFFIQLFNEDDLEKLENLALLNLRPSACEGLSRPEVSNDATAITVHPISDKINTIASFVVNGVEASFIGNSVFSVPNTAITANSNVLQFNQSPGNLLNGISTFDIILLQKMLLGIDDIEMSRAIAGDVDKSGDITFTKDVVLMKRLIFGIETEISGGHYFITSRAEDYSDFNAFDFENNFDQYTFDQSEIDSVNGIELDIHKYGDLNENFTITRSNEVAKISAENRSLSQGELSSIEISLASSELKPYIGLQFGLTLDGMEIIDIIHEYGSDLSHLISDDRGGIKLIANSRELISRETFNITLKVKAKQAGQLKNMLAIDTSFDQEYISSDLDVLGIELDFENQTDSSIIIENIESIRAYPNPAKEGFTISVPESMIGQKMEIYNTTGQLELRQTIESLHTVIDRSVIRSKGLKVIKISHDHFVKVTLL